MMISQHIAENIGPFNFSIFQLKGRTGKNGIIGGSKVDSREDTGASVKGIAGGGW